MGIASGVAELRGDDYFGPTLNTAARVMAAGHGGQVLRAASTASLVDDVVFVDLGLRALRDLSAPVQLFQVCAEGLRADFPALRTLDAVPGNLRAQNTSFIGRDDAVDIVVDAVGSHPLVTLIGVGGVGKTRLALQSAAILAPGFRDGGGLSSWRRLPTERASTRRWRRCSCCNPNPGARGVRSWSVGCRAVRCFW